MKDIYVKVFYMQKYTVREVIRVKTLWIIEKILCYRKMVEDNYFYKRLRLMVRPVRQLMWFREYSRVAF